MAMASSSALLFFSPCFPPPTKLCGAQRIFCVAPVTSLFSRFAKTSEARSFISEYYFKGRLLNRSRIRNSRINNCNFPAAEESVSSSSLVCFFSKPAEDGGASSGVEELEAEEAALLREGEDQESGGEEQVLQNSGSFRARKVGGGARAADSTDWIASSLTRRFGLGAGLAWVGVLAFGVVSEQVKTRTEVFLEEQGTRDVENAKEVVLPNNIRYVELRAGGGVSPQRGNLVVVDLVGKIMSSGEVFVDTTARNKRSLAFVFGARPYAGGMCDGLEFVLRSMKVGGKRRVVIPPELGFGETGADLSSGARIPGQATLEYVVQLQRASIAPS